MFVAANRLLSDINLNVGRTHRLDATLLLHKLPFPMACRMSHSPLTYQSSFGQDGLTGSAWGDWANYTASPLRASDA